MIQLGVLLCDWLIKVMRFQREEARQSVESVVQQDPRTSLNAFHRRMPPQALRRPDSCRSQFGAAEFQTCRMMIWMETWGSRRNFESVPEIALSNGARFDMEITLTKYSGSTIMSSPNQYYSLHGQRGGQPSLVIAVSSKDSLHVLENIVSQCYDDRSRHGSKRLVLNPKHHEMYEILYFAAHPTLYLWLIAWSAIQERLQSDVSRCKHCVCSFCRAGTSLAAYGLPPWFLNELQKTARSSAPRLGRRNDGLVRLQLQRDTAACNLRLGFATRWMEDARGPNSVEAPGSRGGGLGAVGVVGAGGGWDDAG